MRFDITFSTTVRPEDQVEFKLGGVPGRWTRTGEPGQWFVDIPDHEPLQLHLLVYFPKYSEEVALQARSFNARGIELHQVSDHFVRADIRHRDVHGEEACTVRCPTSGAQRTGHSVCIECRGKIGTVKICC